MTLSISEQSSLFNVATNNQVLFGTVENDTINIADFANTVPEFTGDRQILFTSSGDDRVNITLAIGGNRIDLGSGNDSITAGTNNRLLGGIGNDQFFLGDGEGNNRVAGDEGADIFYLLTDLANLPTFANIVTDFDPTEGDLLAFSNTDLQFADLGERWQIEQRGENSVIQVFGQELAVIQDFLATNFTADHFRFTNQPSQEDETDEEDNEENPPPIENLNGNDATEGELISEEDIADSSPPFVNIFPTADRNQDGITDNQQSNLVSLAALNRDPNDPHNYFTLIATTGLRFTNVRLSDYPTTQAIDAPDPDIYDFSNGFLNFDLEGLNIGAKTTLSILLPQGFNANSYWIYDTLGDRWQDFRYDGDTGAQFFDLNGDNITDRLLLHLRDGGRGDKDGIVNGIIQDPSAPAQVSTNLTLNTDPSQEIFRIDGLAGVAAILTVTHQQSDTDRINELGIVRLDENNAINGILPTQAGFQMAALTQREVIFSSLPDDEPLIDSLLTKSLSVGSGDRFLFYLTTQTGQTFFSMNNLNRDSLDHLQVSGGNNRYQLAWEDEFGTENRDFNDLVVNIALEQRPSDLQHYIANTQVITEQALIDLRYLTGERVNATFSVYREANNDNTVGFYEIDEITGEIDDLLPSERGYADALLQRRVTGLGLAVGDKQTATTNITLESGKLYAPFLLVNQTPDSFNGDLASLYIPFAAGNSDRISHIRLLSENTFGFEDIYGGGDFDFNDLIVRATFSIA